MEQEGEELAGASGQDEQVPDGVVVGQALTNHRSHEIAQRRAAQRQAHRGVQTERSRTLQAADRTAVEIVIPEHQPLLDKETMTNQALRHAIGLSIEALQ